MELDFGKMKGLIPAVVQERSSGRVLMTGFMNREALAKTKETGLVTFYSRTRESLWTKGETSKNYLHFEEVLVDCDKDTFLIYASPDGPTCHTGEVTCFSGDKGPSFAFLADLEKIIKARKNASPESSYTAKLFSEGVAKIAQKVGEEAVEVVIDAVKGDNNRLIEESADLLYHLTVLLAAKDLSLTDVVSALSARQKNNRPGPGRLP